MYTGLAWVWKMSVVLTGYVHRFSLGVENERADAGRDGLNPSRETIFSGANGDREELGKTNFPSSSAERSRAGLKTMPIDPKFAVCDDHTCIHTYLPTYIL